MKYPFVLLVAATSLLACESSDKKAKGNLSPEDSLRMVKQQLIDEAAKTATPPVVADMANYTTIQWLDSTFIDLGKQKEGKEIEITFRFKNTGTKNLVIESVNAQCGCTIPEKPENAFAPGEEGVIKAKFNGAGHDETRKQVYVKANIQPDGADTLTFRAQLVK